MSTDRDFHHCLMLVKALKEQKEALLEAIKNYAQFWEETVEEGPFDSLYEALEADNFPKILETFSKNNPRYMQEIIKLLLCTASAVLGPVAANALFGAFSISLDEALYRGMDQAILEEEEQYLKKGQAVPQKLQEAANAVRNKEEQLPITQEDKELLKYAQRAQTNKVS